MEKTIQQVLTPHYMERFKKAEKNYPQTLFGMDWKMLEKGRCPICTCKLHLMQKSPRYYCKSKSHKKAFTIPKEAVDKALDK